MADLEHEHQETPAKKFLRKVGEGGGAARQADPVRFAKWLHTFFRSGNLGVGISHGNLSKEDAQAALRDIWEEFGRVT